MALSSTGLSTDALPLGQVTGLQVEGIAQEPIAPSRSSRYYQPGLDVLRCLAFFFVLNHHVFPKSHTGILSLQSVIQEFGAAGVCLFFTLSAFLITELLLREAETSGTIHLRAFYIRRILRIWPLYLLALFVGVVFPHIYHHFQRGEYLLLPYLLMAGNWALVLHGETRNTILAPLWSISVEEQFYVIWPTLFLLWRKRGVVFTSLIILPIAWATDFILPAAHIPKHPQLWFNSFSQFQFFAIGGLLAILMHRRTLRLALSLRLAALVAALACFSLAAFPCHFQNPFVASKPLAIMGGYMAIDVGCVLFLIAFLDVKLPSLFNPLVYLGKISYGLYVFHMFILAAVSHLTETVLHLPYSLQLGLNWIITVLVVIPLASLSYEYFEKPFLRFKERFTFVNSRSV